MKGKAWYKRRVLDGKMTTVLLQLGLAVGHVSPIEHFTFG